MGVKNLRGSTPHSYPIRRRTMAKRLKDSDRREVTEKIETWDKYKFDDDLDQIIENLKAFRASYKKYHRITVEEDTEYGYYNDSWTNFEVKGVRWETDEEMDKRIKKTKIERKQERRRPRKRLKMKPQREQSLKG
jgi:hypothetical protein